MTESVYITALDVIQCALGADHPERLLSVGTPAGHVELRLLDDEAREVRPGEIGEIAIRSDSLSPGYWKTSEGAAGSLVDGWFHTGDLGRMDENGYLYIVDRKKDMVLVGGSNVYTAEVESVLSQHPFVRECAVISVPRPGEGEEVLAVIVPRAGATIGLDEVRRFAGERLAAYKVPTRLDLRPELPRTGMGKVDKKTLRQEYWGERARRVN
jgi:long-chain acyl-CoA synthetase